MLPDEGTCEERETLAHKSRKAVVLEWKYTERVLTVWKRENKQEIADEKKEC